MARMVRTPCDENQIEATPAAAPCAPAAQMWVLVTVIVASSMAFIEGTATHLALPALQAELGATAVEVQWVVQAYALMLAALILVGGAMGDRFGRKRVFMLGVALFTVTSVWCGFAPNTGQLIVARIWQGVGAALLVPGSLAIISASFTEAERGKAIGTWSGFSALTTALGPVLGGWLVENLSWRWVFFINVPLAILVLLLAWRFVPESRDERAADAPLDWLGALLITVGLGGLVYGLTESSTQGFGSPAVIATLVIGTIGIVAFVLVEQRVTAPLMPLYLFQSSSFSGANLLTLLLYAALGGALYFFPLNLIQVQGYTATAAGFALLPFVLTMFLLSRWTGGLTDRFGARRPLIIGPIIVAAGFLLFAVPSIGGSYWQTFFPAVMVMSIGMAISVPPLTTTVMNAVERSHAGVASGINNAMSRTAGLLAISLMGIIMFQVFDPALTANLADVPLTAETASAVDAQRDRLAGIEVPATADDPAAVERAVQEAFVSGYRMVMYVSSLLAVASAVAAGLMIKDRPTALHDHAAEADTPTPQPALSTEA